MGARAVLGRFFRARRSRWRIVTLLIGTVFWIVVLGVVAAATCRPAWYAPATIDQERLKSDKREFVHLLDSIGEALNRGVAIDFELDEAQVNRWIAARAELPSDWQFEVQGAAYPQVSFLDGSRIRLAATVGKAGVEVVLSAIVHVELSSEGVLVRLDSVRAGALPAPRGAALDSLQQMLGPIDATAERRRGTTISLPNEWTWPNGKRRFRVRRLELDAGVVRVSLEPVRAAP